MPFSLSPVRTLAAAALVAAALPIAALAQRGPAIQPEVPFVPTPENVVERMLELTDVTAKDYVIDLGSGDGRIAIAAAKRGAKALGVDIDPQRIEEATANAKKAGVTDKVTFRQQDLFETPIEEATVITMYLLPRVNLRLRPKLLDLKPGTRLVSHAFDMAEWKADRQDRIDNRDVYFWIVPAKVEGRWELTDGNRKLPLTLKQTFQEFEGTAAVDGRSVPIKAGQLRGDQIQFTLELDGNAKQYKGRVSGNNIEGEGGWRATRS